MTTTPPEPALRVGGVHRSYGRHHVLRGVDLELPAGRLAGVVGENGAGKSTLLNILAGRLSPDAGTVHCPGRLGYCPQQTVLNPAFTVDQHLRFFQVAYDLPDLKRAHALLEVLNFTGYRRHRVAALSGGTRQKLNLTLALMHDPPLLLLDEPYQGFDWDTYQRFWDLAAELRDRGRSILVVSHIAFDTARFDRLWHLEAGRLVEGAGASAAPAPTPAVPR
ncbi:ABC transporter ATP-binding protein [Marinitenerispora sediminis]|uniref:ABC transporter n=1 Tax=Marinitenerispora sediminis TaxID=1931232 RepID=A0A368T2Z1_9ACTN|nr:ABC transporter ATP-binding protein [Marinitenerispora sediminis]RCV48041.1 ABC transporter [Marinitenerispora sediminis]RCV49095.1 ABC transporter [Marinitenerispora sediminis]RCV51052.1 ABC transporter [Marinitenerispora sediminis]